MGRTHSRKSFLGRTAPLGLALGGVVLSGLLALPGAGGAAPAPSVAPARVAAAAPVPVAPALPRLRHDIPFTATVQIYVRPTGNVLTVLVRAPLEGMRDIVFPTRGPGFLNISEAENEILEAANLWILDYIRFYEGDTQLTGRVVRARVSIPADPSFQSFETALANISGPPLSDDVEMIWQQALLDVHLEYPIQSEASRFSVDSELAHLGLTTNTLLRFQLPGSEERLFQYTGWPGLIELDPSWFQAAARFVRLGFWHILEGIDHLLFIFCLVIPFRRLAPLLTIVTSFTVAHSITLVASALGFAPDSLWFPPLIETLIAVSILFMAFENIVGANLQRRWIVAFGFGLVHGFGFSFLLRESLQLAGSHLTTSLFSFNVGVELGQIGVLLVTVPALGYLFRKVIAERVGVILLSALVAHTAWHWTTERWATFRAYPFPVPTFDIVFLLTAMRWATALLILVGIVWGLHVVFGRLPGMGGKSAEAPEQAKAAGASGEAKPAG